MKFSYHVLVVVLSINCVSINCMNADETRQFSEMITMLEAIKAEKPNVFRQYTQKFIKDTTAIIESTKEKKLKTSSCVADAHASVKSSYDIIQAMLQSEKSFLAKHDPEIMNCIEQLFTNENSN